jgi:ABC-type transporter Mla subunit MlaD
LSISVYTTAAICVVILLFFLVFILRWNEKSVTQGPALLTMLGIGGTFFGIAMGLLAFRSTDVQGSIPGLIDGIRTAVWASFVGVVCAIGLKLRYAFDTKLDSSEIAVDNDPIALEIRSLRRAIIGDDESSIVTQMKLSRLDTNTRLDAIVRSQDEFMQKMAEMSSKALIEALREVIADFNAKINEQFGDNFKQLNEAVGRLLTWQEQYKKQLAELIEAQENTADEMRGAVDQYRAALKTTESLVKVASDMRSMLNAVDSYKENLAANTERLSLLVDMMRESTPKLQTAIEGLVKNVEDSIVRSEGEVERIGQEISERFTAASNAVRDSVTASLATANKEVNDNISRLLGSTKELTESLQNGLEESLTTSLETLAAQLASLSNRFASDYGPIADRLREVVAASK